jgi:hypothetical protein
MASSENSLRFGSAFSDLALTGVGGYLQNIEAQDKANAQYIVEQYKVSSQGRMNVARIGARELDVFADDFLAEQNSMREELVGSITQPNIQRYVARETEKLNMKQYQENRAWSASKQLEQAIANSNQTFSLHKQRAGYHTASIAEIFNDYQGWIDERTEGGMPTPDVAHGFETLASTHLEAVIKNGSDTQLKMVVDYLKEKGVWNDRLNDQYNTQLSLQEAKGASTVAAARAEDTRNFVETGEYSDRLYATFSADPNAEAAFDRMSSYRYKSTREILDENEARRRSLDGEKSELDRYEDRFVLQYINHRRQQLQEDPYQYALSQGVIDTVPTVNYRNPNTVGMENARKSAIHDVMEHIYGEYVSYYSKEELKHIRNITNNGTIEQQIELARMLGTDTSGKHIDIGNHLETTGAPMAFAVLAQHVDPRISERVLRGEHLIENLNINEHQNKAKFDTMVATSDSIYSELWGHGIEGAAGHIQTGLPKALQAAWAYLRHTTGKDPGNKKVLESLGLHTTGVSSGTSKYKTILTTDISSGQHNKAVRALNEERMNEIILNDSKEMYTRLGGKAQQINVEQIKQHAEWVLYDYGVYILKIQPPGQEASIVVDKDLNPIIIRWDGETTSALAGIR